MAWASNSLGVDINPKPNLSLNSNPGFNPPSSLGGKKKRKKLLFPPVFSKCAFLSLLFAGFSGAGGGWQGREAISARTTRTWSS